MAWDGEWPGLWQEGQRSSVQPRSRDAKTPTEQYQEDIRGIEDCIRVEDMRGALQRVKGRMRMVSLEVAQHALPGLFPNRQQARVTVRALQPTPEDLLRFKPTPTYTT
jgi:hypothetical protein